MGEAPDPTEFTEFARELEPKLRFALAGRLRPDIAREATEEALVYAWTNWSRVRTMANPGGYLYTVAKRWGWRRKSNEVALPELGVDDPSPPEPGLVDAMRRLSTKQRQIVYLVEGLGLSQHEAARLLGLSRTTVQTHLGRALHHLREDLGVTVDE